VGHYTERGGGASRLGTSVAVHHSCSGPKRSLTALPLRVTVLCVPMVVGEAAGKVEWGVLYLGHA
jgi:hypothetical protein